MSIGVHWLGDPHGFWELDVDRQTTLRAYHKAVVEMASEETAILPIPMTQQTYMRACGQMSPKGKKRR